MSALSVEADAGGGAAPPQPSDTLVLRLYVTGNTLRSTRAVDNARRLLETYAAGRFELEVIDIYLHPEAAIAAQIIAAPTLVKLRPGPSRRVIGDLSDSNKVLALLGVTVSNVTANASSGVSVKP
ncbi:Circadian clock protein KaiB [Caballeronia sp. SBC1]|uniref:circadian clock KaiB family protein n=1 Tax=unclassified Caballeronia TaxID=2646786 RepID=UPI0013E10CD4|nr:MULTISPECIES: circadian clock KaiB family protein [unclassified Caballeronia]QIE23934.1 Circadian clock protein KaiB [Caballeronia sp. SBC2]QIN61830.1 Circadian clock protein KaiB [Caballeronia sp. SBC1]